MQKSTININKELKSRVKIFVAKNPPETIQSFVEKAVKKELDKKEK